MVIESDISYCTPNYERNVYSTKLPCAVYHMCQTGVTGNCPIDRINSLY